MSERYLSAKRAEKGRILDEDALTKAGGLAPHQRNMTCGKASRSAPNRQKKRIVRRTKSGNRNAHDHAI